jgi:hypothetical protein
MSEDQAVVVRFDLGTHGWATCLLKIDDAELLMDGISYTTDALGDLVRAALMIASGGQQAECSFDREPAEWRLLLSRQWSGVTNEMTFHVRVLELDDFYREAPTDTATECFAAVCAPNVFARTVEQTALEVLKAHGAEKYLEDWGTPFPHKALSALTAALASEMQ